MKTIKHPIKIYSKSLLAISVVFCLLLSFVLMISKEYLFFEEYQYYHPTILQEYYSDNTKSLIKTISSIDTLITNDTIRREYICNNVFKEFGYFMLDTTTSYNLFKIEKDYKWYVKIENEWQLFYYDKINDTLKYKSFYITSVGDGEGGIDTIYNTYYISKIIWKDHIFKNRNKLRILQYSNGLSSDKTYIFDPQKGIIGWILPCKKEIRNIKISGDSIDYKEKTIFDTCWRVQLLNRK